MREYSHLVSDESLATKYMDLISSEYHRTKEMLEILYGQPLNERRSRMYTMIEERSARMRPLHALQISQIREWRALKADGKEEEAARKLPEMLLVLNAIAGGMGSTG
jgi:phosphoenolpyruvate carboxylase